jgi:metal-responsive CopG/Arc/MetJ family transcriptional regulator
MAKAKVAVTLDSSTLERLDRLVERARFLNRSQAIEIAVQEKLERLEHRRLAEECAKLDPAEEQALADLGWEADGEVWPEY